MLEINEIKKSYGNNLILNKVSFSIDDGEIISIIGSSGCGKTTLLKCITKLVDVDDGKILLDNVDLLKLKKHEVTKKIGVVLQDYSLFDNMNVLRNITIGMEKINNISRENARKIAENILTKFGVYDKFDSYSNELSGGQKQRVAIARALSMNPKVLLLDEPTSALDKESANELLNIIKDIAANKKISIIIVSHDNDFVEKISNRVLQIKDGKITEVFESG